MKHVQIVLFKQAMTLARRRGSRAKFLQGIRDREHHIRRLRMPMIITFVSRHFLLNHRFVFYWVICVVHWPLIKHTRAGLIHEIDFIATAAGKRLLFCCLYRESVSRFC